MEYVTWDVLATSAGALAMVLAITQATKGIGFLQKIPTQIWSWIVAMAVIYLADVFTGRLTIETAALVPFNAVLVALSANGGFEALGRVFKKKE